MKDRFINTVHVEGRVYQHDLKKKVTGQNSKNPGVEFITGNIEIATDNAMLNIVPVHYTYVTATTAKGTPDPRWEILNNLVEGKLGTVMTSGTDNAIMVRIDSAVALNEFYSNRTGEMELVSNKRNEGGFIHLTTSLDDNEDKRCKFETDILATKFTRMEANEERNLPERGILSGYIFDFRNSILPVSYTILNNKAMDYFESLGITEKTPYFNKVWGKEVSETIKVKRTIEGMFATEVQEVERSYKDFVITNMNPEPYELGEGVLTGAELMKLKADRETYLATIKQRQEDFEASRSNGNSAFAAPAASNGGFNF